MTTLNEQERERLREVTSTITDGLWTEEHDPLLFVTVEAILTARLAKVEALADEWAAGYPDERAAATRIRAALASDPTHTQDGTQA